jgi:hypothetical protein
MTDPFFPFFLDVDVELGREFVERHLVANLERKQLEEVKECSGALAKKGSVIVY